MFNQFFGGKKQLNGADPCGERPLVGFLWLELQAHRKKAPHIPAFHSGLN